ncbi:UDP-GlcNAc:betaGal beta-1,3-N-acetylglucosaminyltransferase 9 [Salvelinus sp. IW2-2015]|uniref:UDP-GlcNAc:betaGal beta-1,3-N-acetylglucosaminyltransferase 9 n=1 Tax=Salvelinus sp. IW2-2015 TaxID=2691554 RepID=UPI000CDF982B|nr:UDP-GlcNAc:betaGal beta-1,3-N-acetylglucosaminyltransferase 9 [Salvelinus alpinus]XP_023826464.1 UDP-GlcNAc:betaGal beta-1,3-N-acetylglucosaminyltransferase 9 [Salvelinus alpinus]
MRRIHIKYVLCTLLMLGLLCLMLYAHQGFTSTWDTWHLKQGCTSSRALLGPPPESHVTKRVPSTPPDKTKCQSAHQSHFKSQTHPKSKLQSKSKPQAKTKSKSKKDEGTKAVPVLPTRPPFDFEGYLKDKDNRDFILLMDQLGKCSGEPYMLIAIKSVVADFERRQVVRRTWGREGVFQDGQTVKTVFLLGVPRNKTALPLWDRLLAYESHSFGDILLWDFDDTFFNLTLKETHFLQWVNDSCSNVQFIFKGDADVYVNIENILEMVKGQKPDKDLFVGDIIHHAHPIRRRSSKYFVPEFVYGQTMYPSYAGGGGFVMSGHTARRLSEACQQVELFPIDDVFLGMCLQRIGVKPSHHEGFRTFGIVRPSAAPHLQVFDPCFYRELMVVHSLTVPQIWLMWNLLHDPQLSCHSELAPTLWPFKWRGKVLGTTGQKDSETTVEQDYDVKVFVKH